MATRAELELEFVSDVQIKMNKALGFLQTMIQRDANDVVTTVGLDLLRRIQQKTPVRTGRARASWHLVPPNSNQDPFLAYTDRRGHTYWGDLEGVRTGPGEAVVGSNVSYMCVASQTDVVTEHGSKRISTIRVGERVLTQDGTFRRVLAVRSFKAIYKPDLVDVRIAWRSDRSHFLTVTSDHPFLVREHGVFKWVPAGQLTKAMEAWAPRKLSHRKGLFTRPLVPCEVCGKACRQHSRTERPRRFCSNACRYVWLSTNQNPHLGRTRSPEACERIRLGVLGSLNNINSNAARVRPTGTEREVERWLTEARLTFNKQVCIFDASAVVDFEVPNLRLIVEADGTYWHRDQEEDVERDKRILAARPGWQILHFHFAHPRYPVTLTPMPIDGAHYIVCNPGLKSICNVARFKPCRILSVRRYRYRPTKSSRGLRPTLLWDLHVEGMHSFVANGVLVSNTYLEAGSSRQAPNGMVAVSLLEILGQLEVKISERVGARWLAF